MSESQRTRRTRQPQDLTGMQFGRLTVLRLAPRHVTRSGRSEIAWLVRCCCPNRREFEVLAVSLTGGHTQSCGCLREEIRSASRLIDLTGRTFGRLTVLERSGYSGKAIVWLCRCGCAKRSEVRVMGAKLRTGHTQSCGCLQAERAAAVSEIDLTGHRYGRWTVLRFDGDRGRDGMRQWVCVCDCSPGVEHLVRIGNLRSGTSQSCGCYQLERVRETDHTTHGGWGTPEWAVWSGMKQRCLNPKNHAYRRYGGRGILPCSGWKDSFSNFIADMGQRPSAEHELDRFPDNNGGYWCGRCEECIANKRARNVRWATRSQNNRNKRNNRMMTLWGITRTVPDWADALGVTKVTLYRLLDPDKYDAREAVKKAVARGELIKPAHCEHPECTEPRTQGHHFAGYEPENWLRVRWLCSKHHAEAEPSRKLDV